MRPESTHRVEVCGTGFARGFLSLLLHQLSHWITLVCVWGGEQTRIALGVHSEILDLMNIPHVGKSCARLLYKHGLRTAEDVAMTTPVQIATILSLGQTTKSRHKVMENNPQQTRRLHPTFHMRDAFWGFSRWQLGHRSSVKPPGS
jgi:hypothetical protein